MITMFLRSERLGISVIFFVFFSMWWRMVQTMELDNGVRLQEASRIPS
jgi:hypothetical protein